MFSYQTNSCPTDDIHSIYLDKELPFEFVKEYETHLQNCELCRKKQQSLKNVKQFFKADSKSINLSDEFMQQSFSRLGTKMRYSKNTKFVYDFKTTQIAKYTLAAAAAIAIAIILPVRFMRSSQFAPQQMQNNSGISSISATSPISRPVSYDFSGKNIVINGNINDNLAHNVSSGNVTSTQFADVDVFRPEFTQIIILPVDVVNDDFKYRPARPIRDMQDEIYFPVKNMQGSRRE